MGRPPSFGWNEKSALRKLDTLLRKLPQDKGFEKLKKEVEQARKATRRKK